ncbi:MAG: sensor of ECF-type sigma factor [Flavobacterium sp.]|uniref:sensor of ECF-type sigma factor n=1 Tax=Flavobacterium sp. TaxID=239 RepID=UPI00352992B0
MKTKQLLLTLLCLVCVTAFSQNRLKEKQNQIKSIKVAFITNELSLTPDEAAKFWPIYNAFEDKQLEIRKTKLKGYISRMDEDSLNTLTEKEATTMLTQIESAEEDLFLLKKKFNADIRTVLPASKIVKLKKAEEKFNRKLLQQFKEKRNK